MDIPRLRFYDIKRRPSKLHLASDHPVLTRTSMRIAITGATGTVGRVLVAHVLDRGHSVVAMDVAQTSEAGEAESVSDTITTAAAASPSSDKDYKFVKVDLRDYDQVVNALTGCDAVAHLGAIKNPGDGIVATHNKCVVLITSFRCLI